MGPGWGEVFIYIGILYGNMEMITFKNTHTSEHPLPDLRPDTES